MAIMTLDDRTGRIEAIAFPDAYNRLKHLLVKDAVLVVEGNLDYDDFAGGNRVTMEKVLTIDQARLALAKRLVVKVDSATAGNGFVAGLRETLGAFRDGGECPVLVEYQSASAKAVLRLGPEWRVRPADELVKRLSQLSGAGTVRIEY
jgi:DNA polymerase-3 subunit alpha